MTSKAELKTILQKHSGNERFAKILARIAFAPKAGTAEAEAWAERLEVLYATGTVADARAGLVAGTAIEAGGSPDDGMTARVEGDEPDRQNNPVE